LSSEPSEGAFIYFPQITLIYAELISVDPRKKSALISVPK